MNAILTRWHAWAAASATRRQRMSMLADLDFDSPRPRMSRADVAAGAVLLLLSGGFTVWVATLLAGAV
jgi:hypothetical protein